MVDRLRVATRGSALARWQADHVSALLRAASPGLDVEVVVVDTLGDRDKATSLAQLGGQGVFVKEVQAALLDGRADVAVHSAKDLPSNPGLTTGGLTIGAVPPRADPRDALVGRPLHAIAPGGTVATGSARRRAQLADLRPDLTFVDLRGNIDTRLARAEAGDVAAVVVAMAALERLGLGDRAAEVLDRGSVVPQVGQGCLAVECRDDDAGVIGLLAAIDELPSRRALEAERAWLATIGGGCELPAGAHAVVDGESIRLTAVLASFDGRIMLRDTATGSDPQRLGAELATHLLDHGGRWLLAG